MAIKRDITARIKDLLKDHPNGLSITDIVRTVRVNRNTASRYLDTLLISGQVEMRHFGMAKIYTLTRRLPVSSVLAISPVFVLQLDNNYHIIFLNTPFLNLLEIPERDIIGKKIEYSRIPSFFDTEYPRFLRWISEGLSGLDREGELTLAARDRIFSCRVTPAVFAEGQRGVSVMLEDITERKYNEVRLRDSEARLRSIIRAAPVGIGLMVNRVIREVNDRLCEMTGYTDDELIGRSVRMLYHSQEEYDSVGITKYRQIATEGAGSVMTRWVRKDGEAIDILLSSAPLDPAHISAGIIFTALDITKNSRAEAALHESEERYRKLVEISPDAVILHRDGTIMYANPAAETIIGASHSEELIGKPLFDFIDPGFHDVVRENIRKDMSGEFSPQTELRMFRLDGESITVEGRGVRTHIDGKPAVLVTLRDITEHKKKEDALRASEGRYRHLLEQSFDAVIIHKEGVVTYANKSALEIAGAQSCGQLIGQPILRFVHPDSRKLVAARAAKMLAEPGTAVPLVRETFHRLNGEPAEVEVMATSFIDNGTPAVQVVFREITDRVRTENALRASEERYRTLAESATDMIYIVDTEGVVIYGNALCARMAGCTPDDLVGKGQADLFPPEIARQHLDYIRQVVSTGKPVGHEEMVRTPAGTLWKDIRLSPIRSQDGNIISIMGIARDITARKVQDPKKGT